MRLGEVPERLEDFEGGLKRILSSGAVVTERMTLKKLYSRFGREYRNRGNYGFMDHVVELKALLLRNGHSSNSSGILAFLILSMRHKN